MARLFIGVDSNGVPALKITRNSADNPYSTPDSERSKFSYNSNDEALVDIADVVPSVSGTPGANWGSPVSLPGSPNSTKVYFSPPGSNETTYERALVRRVVSGAEQSTGDTFYSTRYFDTVRYACPMLSDFYRNPSTGRYANIVTSAGLTVAGGGYVLTSCTQSRPISPQSAEAINVSGVEGSPAFSCLPANTSVAAGGMRSHVLYQSSGGVPTIGLVLRDVVAQLTGDGRTQTIWNLPGDTTPLDKAAKIPGTSGVKVTKLNPGEFKIARQGHDVETATYDKLVFSAEKRPAKVIAAGDVVIAANSSHAVECGIDLNDTVVVEQAMYASSTVSFPFPYNLYIDDAWNFEYKIVGSAVVFYNDTAQSYHVRYLIIAADDKPPTSGPNRVFRQIEVGGEAVFQILRPGSAEPPSLADIIIDARWPSIPILDEGYLDVLAAYNANPTGGYQSFTVNFANPGGLFPFVKFSVLRETGVGNRYIACSPVVRKRIGAASTGNDFARLGGDTTWCDLLSSTQAVFHAFRGRIIELGTSANRVDSYPVVGIRYYVFGVPT